MLNYRFFVTILGLTATSLISTGSFADITVESELSANYLDSKFSFENTEEVKESIKKMRYSTLNLTLDTLVYDKLYISTSGAYGCAFGKAKADYEIGTDLQEKYYSNNHKHIGKFQFLVGYQIQSNENINITPVIGFEYYAQKFPTFELGQDLNDVLRYHTPIAGLKMRFKATDNLKFGLAANYLWPKIKVLNHFERAQTETTCDKRGHGYQLFLDTTYSVGDQWGITGKVGYQHLKSKGQSPRYADRRVVVKSRNVEIGLGLSYTF